MADTYDRRPGHPRDKHYKEHERDHLPELLKMRTKLAQIWYSDFVLGFTIFMIIVVVTINYISQNYILPMENTDEMIMEGKTISESLIHRGVPDSWNTTDVVRIGLTDGNYVLNSTKIEMFGNMSRDGYEHTKYILGTKYDFLVFFKDTSNNTLNLSHEYIGKPGVDDNSLVADEIIPIKRYLVLKRGQENISAEVVEMHILLWGDL